MSDELTAIGRAAQELEPAAREFALAVGRSGPAQEFVEWVTDEIRYRRQPRKARLLMKAAREVRAAGLPTRAIEDRLLRAVLEEGSLVDHDEMQDRWAFLLANAAVANETPHVAFPSILAQLEPAEARMLDAMSAALNDEFSEHASTSFRVAGFDPPFFVERANVDQLSYAAATANLVRLRLADSKGHYEPPHVIHTATDVPLSSWIQLTYFGAVFVAACSKPGTPSSATILRQAEPV